jgi:hypothetical protein
MEMKATSQGKLVARLWLLLAKLGLQLSVGIHIEREFNMSTKVTTAKFKVVSTELKSDTLWILAKRLI